MKSIIFQSFKNIISEQSEASKSPIKPKEHYVDFFDKKMDEFKKNEKHFKTNNDDFIKFKAEVRDGIDDLISLTLEPITQKKSELIVLNNLKEYARLLDAELTLTHWTVDDFDPREMKANFDKIIRQYDRIVRLSTSIKREFTHGEFTIINRYGYTEEEMSDALETLDDASKKIKAAGFGHILYGNVVFAIGLKNAAGLYHANKDQISLNVKASHYHSEVYTLIHEFGHRVWYKFMGKNEKDEFTDNYKKCFKSSVTKYGSTDPEEDFAEIFAHFVLGEPMKGNCMARFKIAIGRKGDPDAKIDYDAAAREHEEEKSKAKEKRQAKAEANKIAKRPRVAWSWDLMSGTLSLGRKAHQVRTRDGIEYEWYLVAEDRNGRYLSTRFPNKKFIIPTGIRFEYPHHLSIREIRSSKSWKDAHEKARDIVKKETEKLKPFHDLVNAVRLEKDDEINSLLKNNKFTNDQLWYAAFSGTNNESLLAALNDSQARAAKIRYEKSN